MAQFEDLQELWQGQAAARRDRAPKRPSCALYAVYGRRQNGSTRERCCSSPQRSGCAASRCHRRDRSRACLLVGVAAAMLLMLEWRNQRRIARLDFTAPSAGFVCGRTVAKRLRTRIRSAASTGRSSALVVSMNLSFRGAATSGSACRLRASVRRSPTALWFRRKRFDASAARCSHQLSAMQTARSRSASE